MMRVMILLRISGRNAFFGPGVIAISRLVTGDVMMMRRIDAGDDPIAHFGSECVFRFAGLFLWAMAFCGGCRCQFGCLI